MSVKTTSSPLGTFGWMKIVCTECREAFPMYPDRVWYNFVEPSYQDAIGFCSPQCLEVYAIKRKWSVAEGK